MNFFQYLKPERIPSASRRKNVLDIRREIILQIVLNTLLGIYTIGFALIMIFYPQVIRSGKPELYLLPYAGLLIVTLVRTLNFYIRSFFVILALQGLGMMALISYGLSGTGIFFLFGACFLANVLYNSKLSTGVAILSLIIIGVIGSLMINGQVPLPQITPIQSSGSTSQWITAGLVFVFIMALSTGSVSSVLDGMNSTLQSQEKLTVQLAEEQSSLERRVAERSTDLKKRADQFEIASQVAREISGKNDLDTLLDTSASLIRERFGFYHVGIFLTDEKKEYAVLRSATGEAGQVMLERGHRLKIGEIGMVGYVVSQGEARISMDVDSDAVHYKNPLLPETRSELALPLRLGENTIGAMDVQSVVPNAFSHEDVRILQTIADQLAIAFEKTRLVVELQRSLEELDSTDRAATQKAWRSHLRNTRQKLTYRYRNAHLESQAVETEHAQEAMDKGQPVLRTLSESTGQDRPITVLAIPIKLRNQVLGVVDIHFEAAAVSPDLVTLIENTVSRLAVSLENARLLEEIQLRAERERLVGEISTKVRSASDVDSVLRIAIQEIGQSLGVSEVMVQLRKGS